jgi:hypothetical protein
MARLRKQVLGQLQGGIADVKIKYRNGKAYIASKPAQFNTGKDPVTIFKKDQGKFIGKLSSVIYQNTYLKKIWSLSDAPAGYLYQHIWGLNYRSIRNNDLSGIVSLIPAFGFETSNSAIEFDGINLPKITASPLGNKLGINTKIEKKITAAGVIILKNRIALSESEYFFIPANSIPVGLNLTNPVEITLGISSTLFPLLTQFAIRKFYITLITLDASDSPVRYSEVISA